MIRSGHYQYMRPRRWLWRMSSIVLLFVLMSASALAAQPLTGTFKGKVLGQYVRFTKPDGKSVNDWAGVLGLQLDRNTPGDGLGQLVPVFCIQLNVVVRPNDDYIGDGPVTPLHGGCQIRYLLAKYPASTAGTPAEAAARQLAIWHFSDDLNLDTVQDAAIRLRAIVLANEAMLGVAQNGCPGTQASISELSIDPALVTVQPGQPATYTVRVAPPGAAQSVTIKVDGTAVFANGQQQITLTLNQGVATFAVSNPLEGTSTVTAILPYQLDAGTVFSPIDANHPTQRLVMGDRVALTANATVRARWQQGTPTATPTTPSSPSAPTPTTPGGPPTATPSRSPVGTPTNTPPTSTPGQIPDRSPTATATPATSATPTPGRATATPRRPKRKTPTPNASGDTPTTQDTTPLAGQGATPAPSTPGNQATPGVGISDTSGGPQASVPRPRSLPRTAATTGGPRQSIFYVGIALVVIGCVIRRRRSRLL
jgi:hypothetical protein